MVSSRRSSGTTNSDTCSPVVLNGDASKKEIKHCSNNINLNGSYEAIIFEGKLPSTHKSCVWSEELKCPACRFKSGDDDEVIKHMIGCRKLRKNMTDDLIERDKNDYKQFEFIPSEVYEKFEEINDKRIMFSGRSINENLFVKAPISSRVGEALMAGMLPRLPADTISEIFDKESANNNSPKKVVHNHEKGSSKIGNAVKVKAKVFSSDRIVPLYLCKKPMMRRNAATRAEARKKRAKRICCPFVVNLTKVEDSNKPEDLLLLSSALGFKTQPISIILEDITHIAHNFLHNHTSSKRSKNLTARRV